VTRDNLVEASTNRDNLPHAVRLRPAFAGRLNRCTFLTSTANIKTLLRVERDDIIISTGYYRTPIASFGPESPISVRLTSLPGRLNESIFATSILNIKAQARMPSYDLIVSVGSLEDRAPVSVEHSRDIPCERVARCDTGGDYEEGTQNNQANVVLHS
jgi:hypothetical protein